MFAYENTLSGFDEFLQEIGAIRTSEITVPVIYKSQAIGTLTAETYNKRIYLYGYLAFVLLLILALVWFITTITEERKNLRLRIKEKTKDLQRSRNHLQLVFENAPISLWQEDFSAVKTQIDRLKKSGNHDFKAYFDKNPEELEECAKKIKIIDVNRATLTLHHAKTKEELLEGLVKTFTKESFIAFKNELIALAGGADSFHTEATIQTLNGVKKDVLLHLFIDLSQEDWSRTYVSMTDITARKKAEAERSKLENQLRQKYKMDSVGVMAGGMAHNFNNNLSIILGSVELSKMKLPENPAITRHLDNAIIAILRSRDLIQQILTYSRQGVQEKTSVQLSFVIDETIRLLHSTLPTTIKLQEKISVNCQDLTINADPSQIQECLINLCNNSMYAMEEKGDLTISLESIELKEKNIPAQYESLPGPYAKLSVQDTGSGMSAETIDTSFDLFFTTKPVGEGTGVGLSTVMGIVKDHGGLIKIKSTLGHGTTFELYFPVVDIVGKNH